MKEKVVRKAMGPEGVWDVLVRKCAQHLARSIHNFAKSSIDEGGIPKCWQGANTFCIEVYSI